MHPNYHYMMKSVQNAQLNLKIIYLSSSYKSILIFIDFFNVKINTNCHVNIILELLIQNILA